MINKLMWLVMSLVAVIFIGCNKEEVILNIEDPVNLSKITTSYGMPENIVSYSQIYNYNDDGNLTSIEDTRAGESLQRVSYSNDGKIDSLIYEIGFETNLRFITFEYEGDRLMEIHDNHITDQFGTRVHSKEYKYNNDGYVEEEFSTFQFPTSILTSTVEYKWKNGNIEKTKHFNSDGELELEVELIYDEKKNFARNNVILANQYPIWSKNNIVRSITTDYTGLYDPACFDCTSSYTYTSDDYAKTIEGEWGTLVEIEYE